MLKLTQEQKIFFLQALFIASLILANILGSKITTLGPINFSVTIWLIALTFLITDILEEVKGKQIVQNLVWTTVVILFLSFLFIQWTVWLDPAPRYTDNEAFVKIFQNSSRIFLASIIAFILGQYHDIWAFDFWKKKTKGKFLWLRNNASTMVSQFIDTTIFMFLAFYMMTPKFDAGFIWSLIWPYYIFKVILSAVDTPLCYLGVKWLKEKENK
jgi:uncharacterized integral membrane protein (TIGR00697 family)